MPQRLIPTVLSGGSGTRLWPLSTEQKPKQFHALGAERTLIQTALTRLAAEPALEVLAPIVICSARHAGLAARQMEEVSIEPHWVVLEPFGRNTAPAAAIAALLAEAEDPDALVLLMPADHLIGDGFAQTVARAAPAAREHLVVFGVEPTGPETGYGYIETGPPLQGEVRAVARFAEKPVKAVAEQYVASGRHLWNAGIFLFSPSVMLAQLAQHAPEVLAAARAALDLAHRDGARLHLDTESFALSPSISLDYAVMEKTDRAAVAPIGADWADIGSWSELWRLGAKTIHGNVVRGDTQTIDVKDCLIWSESGTLGVIGVSDLIIVQTESAVIVLPRDRAQDVKLIVDQVKAAAAERGV